MEEACEQPWHEGVASGDAWHQDQGWQVQADVPNEVETVPWNGGEEDGRGEAGQQGNDYELGNLEIECEADWQTDWEWRDV